MEDAVKNKKLHLVMLGQDASLVDESSESAQRTMVYGQFFAGINVYIFAKKSKKEERKYGNIVVRSFSTILQSLYALIRIYKDIQRLKKGGVDVLVSTQDPFEIGLLGLIISRMSGLLLHVQVHTDISSTYMQKESIRSRMQMILAKFVLKRASRIRAVSKRVEDFCFRKYSIAKKYIDYIPMVYKEIHTEGVAPEMEAHSETKIFLVPARFVRLKRIPYLIDAFSEVVKKDPSIMLQIVGKGPEEKNILAAIQRNNLSHRVEFISWTKDMKSLYKNAYAVIVTSLYEGWCRVVTESVMNYTPVIMTDVGCAHEWLEDGKQGIIVPIENKDALVMAITKISEDALLYETLVKGCTEKASTIQSFTEYAKKIVVSWQATTSQSK